MLRHRNFLLLWLAQLISAAGDTFTYLALMVRIDGLYGDSGGSARALGGLMIALGLPQLLVGLVAGTFVDRWDRRRVLIGADLARAALVPLFVGLRTTADLPWAYAVAFLLATFGVFFYPARTAWLPSLVGREELMAANGWMQTGRTGAMLAGPVLAGVVIGRWGVQAAFWVDAASYLASAGLVAAIWGVSGRPGGIGVPHPRPPEGGAPSRSPWQDLREGIRFARRSRLLQALTLGLSLAMLGVGAVNVLFVPFLRHVFGAPPEFLGLLQSAQGAGMLAGGLLVGIWGRRLPPRGVAVGTLALLALGVAFLGLAPGPLWMVPGMVWVGWMVAPLNAALQTLLQRHVPPEVLGRAGSVMEMAIAFSNLVSMGAAGWLAGTLGLRETFLFAGGALLAGALGMAWMLRGGLEPRPRPAPLVPRPPGPRPK